MRGKTVLLQRMVLDLYRDCFDKIFIFSPSVFIDSTWAPVRSYIENELQRGENVDSCFFETYKEEDLATIIDNQAGLIKKVKQTRKSSAPKKAPFSIIPQEEEQKEPKRKKKSVKLPSILIILDDVVDDARLVRHSKLLHTLFIRGRHYAISTVISTQKYCAISPVLRTNAITLYVFKLRSMQDLNCFLEENAALLGKDVLFKVYQEAVSDQPYRFLQVKLNAQDINKTFMLRLERFFTFDEQGA